MNKITKLYLKARKHYLKKRRFLAILIKKYMRFVYGCEIPFTCNIAESVHFAHNALGVVINEKAFIGENCIIYQNVTIGNRKQSDAPKIGKNVLIGANAVIIGDIIIGDNAKIGAGAIVVKDVPEGCTVVPETVKFITPPPKNSTLRK